MVLYISCLFLSICYPEEIVVIKDPKPTHFEKRYVQLKKVNTLNNDFDIDNDNFIGNISSTAIDNDGNLFIFDKLQVKIFKFGKDLRFIKKFGQEGQGPGEFAVHFSSIEINTGYDNQLYVSDQMNRRLHVFDLNGKFIKDHKVEYPRVYKPVVSKSGNIYIPAEKNDGIIDVFNKNMELITTLLDRSEFDRFIFRKPGLIRKTPRTRPYYKKLLLSIYSNHLLYNVLPDDRLFVLLINDPTLYIFEKFKLIKKIKILPQQVLENYKRDYLKELLEDEDSFYDFVRSFFVDKDDNRHFYLQFLKDRKKNWDVLYKFSLSGKLIEVLYAAHKAGNIYLDFLFKKNNVFYARDMENILLYKEVK